MTCSSGCGQNTSARLHDLGFWQPGLRGLSGEPFQVPPEERTEVRVDDRRRGAFVFAEDGEHLVRCGYVHIREALGERRGNALLVARIGVGVQKADCDRLHVRRFHAGNCLRQRLGVQRSKSAAGCHPLAHREPQVGGHERYRPGLTRPVELGPRLPADLDHIRESLGCDQRRARSVLGQQGVGADRHPMCEAAHCRRFEARLRERELNRGHHSL
jgi:hypothetical protein